MPGQEITIDNIALKTEHLASDGLPVSVDASRDTRGIDAITAIHQHFAARRARPVQPAATLKVDIPDSISAALTGWARQLANEASTDLRNDLAQADGDMAVLLDMNEQIEADRDILRTQLATVTEDRDQAQVTLAECEAQIERLKIELQHAREVASNALVGKAKDQLAIEGKDAQLAELRLQLERNLSASAAESDARLAAEMELVGAVTARDNLAAEVKELRTQLDAVQAARRNQ